MKSKKLPCELCDREVPIRSTVKTGEYKGKKVCQICKLFQELPPISNIKVNSGFRSMKTQKKRQEERKGYPKFFRDSIEDLKKHPFCQNCGERIADRWEPHHNIAHILPKQRYKSVATHPDNKLFLCASKDYRNACHEKFDSGASTMLEMPCIELVIEKFQKFKGEVTENGKLFHILAEYKPTKQ